MPVTETARSGSPSRAGLVSNDALSPALARTIARFVVTSKGRELSPEVTSEVVTSVVDTVACMLVGSSFPSVQLLSDSPLHRSQGEIEATLIGIGGRRSLLDVALIGGASAHVADYDDVSWAMMGHPSAVLVPAVLALAESVQASGAEVARAYVVGFEVMVSLGRSMAPRHYLRGWHATATLGPIGAAAAAAALLDLDETQVLNALGIAASHSGGLRQNFGSMVKALHVGLAGRSGLESALLARAGFTADAHALDGEWGFVQAFTSQDWVGTTSGAPGADCTLLTPGILRKQYPSCGATHQAIDAARAILARSAVDPADVVAISVGGAPACFAPLLRRLPETPLEAKFSMEFVVACAVVFGEVTLGSFTTQTLHDPRVTALMAKVVLAPHPDLQQYGESSNAATAAEVAIRLRDGRVETDRVILPRGEPTRPLSPAALERKFTECAEPVLGAARSAQALQLLRDLPKLAELGQVVHHLTPPANRALPMNRVT